ncbi:MAG TPA: tRNA (adenosine(37)-N6)-threonylcarbamoyltransferase complex transferase subunit TsaD [Syntrophales bacterium]|nr:tRNA (adenosine(37)-N6)-threonylcarbamoyltransferase complex transferase subunit TsaD [Syntrophales bacterium]HPI56933.1 tRNA (adenosine(37)-N6)-threonylcarbamoyltransferase complex transferase subunit TsaD [Syntrophales bacterium]HPN23519.1 tRNA (adenosine(37)-N6)-threonylcarbamoyltransferase complex transferase subunit TsaD [Syntrophales bacterium]HQM27956.1 tRNA (adenosine(37)-N6)-threonylcarbamoyltransferase complex transferase subunit TsaD [Syntrophales bacterium]
MPREMRILAIETSCDETAAAIVRDGREVLSSIVSSQADIHSKYGGVVPEIASRKHVESIVPVIRESLFNARLGLDEIDGIAVTRGPGLIGSLLVGLSVAKSIAFAKKKPLVGVNHLEGHVASVFLSERVPAFPFVALVVSGGHTIVYLARDFQDFALLGQTRDDAAGEAFDKAAKLLDIGYPGGVVIDRLAKSGNPGAVAFPRPMKGSLDFSFSGVKTALLTYTRKRKRPIEDGDIPDIVASYQEAIIDVLVEKTLRAAELNHMTRVVVVGGVAANSRLRQRFMEAGAKRAIDIFIPPPVLCTDNAAMIAVVGDRLLAKGKRDGFDLNAVSRWPLETLPG